MLFNSFTFAIFFPIVTVLYFLLPYSQRWLLLLVASCVFYAYFIPKYLLILFFLIIVDYFAGIWISSALGMKRKLLLTFSIIANCSVLFAFKYFNLFANSLTTFAQFIHWNYSLQTLNVILPIGLSFHTFQSMSYTIEVFYGRQKVERNFGIYALYVMFYPQLVAGPIERPQHLLHQFYERHEFDFVRIKSGLQLMLGGLFKKIVIADRLAIFVDEIYNNSTHYKGIPLWIATYFFAFQIFCDFSGYTDIARGVAKVMGFSLIENFNRPYFSKSIAEFWRRWHISLSSWFRDYLYIPLGGSRMGQFHWAINIIIVFLVSGLWHGANWTFAIWGLLHGLFIIFSKYSIGIRNLIKNIFNIAKNSILEKVLSVAITFHLACFAWIFFRATSVSDAFYITKHLFVGIFDASNMIFLQQKGMEIFWGIVLIFALVAVQLYHRSGDLWNFIEQKPKVYRWAAYYFFVLSLIILSIANGQNTPQKFIYFQF